MDITLPTIPAGVLVLLGLLAPYVQALIQRPQWSPGIKKVIAVALALVLTVVVLAFYYVYTGDTVPAWPVLVLLALVVAQASYTLATKSTATALETRTSPKQPVPTYNGIPNATPVHIVNPVVNPVVSDKVTWTPEERAEQYARDADVDQFNADHP